MDVTHLYTISWVLLHLTWSVSGTQIILERNGYSNIVIAISPDVASNQADTIIQNLKLMITRASRVLHRATEKRAFFKDVRILIPEFWDRVRANESSWETFNKADIRVAPPSFSNGDIPYTLQSGGCGQEGEYIHFTPNYLITLQQAANIAQFGPSEKLFVHEWAHLRYGVFDEYGRAGDQSYPLFYIPQGSKTIQPNLCTDERPSFTAIDTVTQGQCKVDPSTGIYDENCIYHLQPNFDPKSSLMSNYSIDSVVDFCKDDQVLTHVYDAPNKHNAMCGSRSVWTVITSHPDFFQNNNPPMNNENVPDPTFNVVRAVGSRFVLVADVSGSMKDHNRIERLYESARRWIKYDISDGSQLGLVQFNSAATVLSRLIMIDGEASRDSLIAKLPRTAVGGTCIGCGLLKGIEVLRPGGKGGIIMLMTDGEETDPPYISAVMPQLIDSGARVISIAFGRKAEDKIEDLAMQTNGMSFFVDDDDQSQGLNDAYIGSMTFQPAVPADKITVLLFQRQYQNVTQIITASFIVDATVGRNFVFRMDYTQRRYIQGFSLQSPDGTVYANLDYDDVAKVASLKIAEAEVGEWEFTLKVTNSMKDSVAVTVTAQSRSTSTVPITTECYVPDGTAISNAHTDPVRILAKVMQGSNPVISARVTAYVELPDSAIQKLELFDNGAFADTTQDDGIYSRYFVAATTSGRYTVACEVWDDGTAYVSNGFSASGAISLNGRARNRASSHRQTIGGFSRMAAGGSFRVEEPAPFIDPYPPARVFDLRVTAVDHVQMTFTIQFTAPGDDLDQGTVSRYEIKYSPNFDDLREQNFHKSNATLINGELDILDSPVTPEEGGKMQIINFRPVKMQREVSYYLALRGVDEANNTGISSNIVTVRISPEEPSGLSTQAIVAIAIGGGLLAILIVAVIFLIVRKKYRNYQPTSSTAKP